MKRLAPIVCLALMACGPSGLPEEELVERLLAKGLKLEPIDTVQLTQSQIDKLPQPVRMFSVRISDANGNRDSVTLLNYKSDAMAAKADAAGVNGFPARNWFFAGMLPKHFEQPIQEALQ